MAGIPETKGDDLRLLRGCAWRGGDLLSVSGGLVSAGLGLVARRNSRVFCGAPIQSLDPWLKLRGLPPVGTGLSQRILNNPDRSSSPKHDAGNALRQLHSLLASRN